MSGEQPSHDQLKLQIKRQNTLIQALQNEIGVLTGEKFSLSIAFQESQQEIQESQEILDSQIAEMDGDSSAT